MIREGQLVLFRFPGTDQVSGKLRPALVIQRAPGSYDDWLICMISSRVFQCIENFDELIAGDDSDFVQSGLKCDSIARISRLAVVNRSVLCGTIGAIAEERLLRIRRRIADWILKG
jgi:mRNA interferase MazF